MKHIQKYILLLSICLILMVTSCQQPGGNSTGSEYMPDMGHSIAYEANYYNYYYNIHGVLKTSTMSMLNQGCQ